VQFDGTVVANYSGRAVWLLEDLVKTRIQSLSFLATLAVVLGLISWGSALNAQTTPSTPTDTQTQPAPTPDTPPTQQTQQPPPSPDVPPATQQTPSSQTPDQTQTPDSKSDAPPSAATPSATDTQTFSGTVVKSGDKYMLKTDSGKTYDIDHQDDVMKFDGKRVKVQGKLDDTGTKILVK
jgi:hypothetical protein